MLYRADHSEPDVLPAPPPDPRAYAVEWHRPDPRRSLYKVWAIGALLLVAGAALLAQAISAGPDMASWVRLIVVIGAVMLSAAGPLLVVITAIRSLADDTCLTLRSDGLHYTSGQESFFVRWGDVMSAAYDEASDSLKVVTESTTLTIQHPDFLGQESRQLAERIDDIRRRALMGLIRPANVWGWEEGRTPEGKRPT